MSVKIFLTTPYLNTVVEPLYDKPVFVRTSLASLAAFLRQETAYTIKCCDAKFENKTKAGLIDKIKEFSPDIIGISSFTYEIIEAGKLAESIKSILPESLIIIGGSHVSAIPEQTLIEFTGFDIGVIGEAELTLKELCIAFENNTGIQDINGIVFRDDEKKILVTKDREKIQDLDILPMPAWDLLPRGRQYFIQTSRGCPFHCNFCFNPNGNVVRHKSVKKIIEEINWLITNMKPDRISFGDEAFGANNEFAIELLDKMIELDIGNKVKWDVQTHVSFITDDLLRKMKLANIRKIELGVESGNDEILRNMGKGINKTKIINAFSLIKKYKIKTGAFLIFGHPDETKKTIWESIRFVSKLNPYEPVFAIMAPFPGTKIFEYVKNNERGYNFFTSDWSKYRKQINGSVQLKTISNSKLKYYLIIGNIGVFLCNLRFLGLIKFSFANLRNVLNFFKHFFLVQ